MRRDNVEFVEFGLPSSGIFGSSASAGFYLPGMNSWPPLWLIDKPVKVIAEKILT